MVGSTTTEAEENMAEDAVTLILKDHRTMEELFDRLQSEPDQRPRLLEEIEAILTAHSRAEEDEVYPAAAKAAGEGPDVRHGTEEHQEAEELLRKLKDCDPKSKEFDKRCKEFVDAVKHHVEEEESDVLPGLKEAVSQKRAEELGRAFWERREQELKRFGLGGGVPKQRELYEEAKELDVENRSKMNKEELAEAVRKARRG
ncbi:hemerythrin domain-containing protein [Nocardiopsis dassonvillei]|uniref:hemerythrin domain-containing protein n=1 Tax=Nocardiopsis dassonvillei TaxID=2014 RepID=UPI0020A3F4FC|nr:hemerythrin domain-containing protein [Nocardiopsis dassonvillei]MCP3015577.1 hemerythrin domain-containing protein [Nocardiopsis dassonvillei]